MCGYQMSESDWFRTCVAFDFRWIGRPAQKTSLMLVESTLMGASVMALHHLSSLTCPTMAHERVLRPRDRWYAPRDCSLAYRYRYHP